MQHSVKAAEPTSEKFQGKLLALTVALITAGVVSGCSSTPQKKPQAKTSKTLKASGQKAQQGALLDANSIDSLESLLSATDMAAVEDNKLAILRYGDVWRRMTAGFKMDLNVQ